MRQGSPDRRRALTGAPALEQTIRRERFEGVSPSCVRATSAPRATSARKPAQDDVVNEHRLHEVAAAMHDPVPNGIEVPRALQAERHVEVDEPAEGLTQIAAQEAATLIVVGSRRGRKRTLPVVIVPPPLQR